MKIMSLLQGCIFLAAVGCGSLFGVRPGAKGSSVSVDAYKESPSQVPARRYDVSAVEDEEPFVVDENPEEDQALVVVPQAPSIAPQEKTVQESFAQLLQLADQLRGGAQALEQRVVIDRDVKNKAITALMDQIKDAQSDLDDANHRMNIHQEIAGLVRR